MDNIYLKFVWTLPRKVAAGLVSAYQVLLSPDHSWLKAKYPYGFCRHYPTCSEYTKQSLLKFGLIKGGWLGAKRVARCNPWAEPAVDNIK